MPAEASDACDTADTQALTSILVIHTALRIRGSLLLACCGLGLGFSGSKRYCCGGRCLVLALLVLGNSGSRSYHGNRFRTPGSSQKLALLLLRRLCVFSLLPQ